VNIIDKGAPTGEGYKVSARIYAPTRFDSTVETPRFEHCICVIRKREVREARLHSGGSERREGMMAVLEFRLTPDWKLARPNRCQLFSNNTTARHAGMYLAHSNTLSPPAEPSTVLQLNNVATDDMVNNANYKHLRSMDFAPAEESPVDKFSLLISLGYYVPRTSMAHVYAGIPLTICGQG
jgi:hypothetical protein